MHRQSSSTAARFIRVGRDRARRAGGRVVLGSLVCAASVMFATSARAEPNDDDRNVTRTVTDVQGPVGFSDQDPCIGVFEFVFGTANQETRTVDRSRGTNFDSTITITQHGVGTSTVSGDAASYKFAFSGETEIKSSTKHFTQTMETREHIIRQDHNIPDIPGFRKDDYFVRTTAKISGLAPNPVFTRNSAEPTCK